MSHFPLVIALLLTAQPAGESAAPGADAIQAAMNAGVDVDFLEFQELSAVKIRSGGATRRDDYLFVCDANLVWKLSSKEFKAVLEKAIAKEAKKQGGKGALLEAFAPLLLIQLAAQLGDFKKGQTVTKVRFRVRMEQAGKDWIVTSSKVVELDTNPLRPLKAKETGAG